MTNTHRYIHTMSPSIRSKFARGINPFDFKGSNSFIRPLDRGISKLNDKGPCVVMASPGFLTNGVSRELLEKWAPDARNGLIITGYSVEGVMARVCWFLASWSVRVGRGRCWFLVVLNRQLWMNRQKFKLYKVVRKFLEDCESWTVCGHSLWTKL